MCTLRGLACETVMKNINNLSVARNSFPDAVQCNRYMVYVSNANLEFLVVL